MFSFNFNGNALEIYFKKLGKKIEVKCEKMDFKNFIKNKIK
jgi:hypothetical protein